MNMDNVRNSLILMAQGMVGIFVTIIVIMIVIWIMGKFQTKEKAEENK